MKTRNTHGRTPSPVIVLLEPSYFSDERVFFSTDLTCIANCRKIMYSFPLILNGEESEENSDIFPRAALFLKTLFSFDWSSCTWYMNSLLN